jgi:cytosine/adenosine deaminase-related metal-dependent hydrolase
VSTLITAAYVLPVSSAAIRNGAVLVGDDGRIADVGPADLIAAGNAERIDLGEAALLPGLINVHAHPELSVFRGLLDDLPFHEWIPTLMRCKRVANLTPEDYEVAARWSCVEVLRSGQTTVAATEPSGAALTAFRAAGLRGRVYLETFGPAAAQVGDSLSDLRARLDAPLRRQTTSSALASHRTRRTPFPMLCTSQPAGWLAPKACRSPRTSPNRKRSSCSYALAQDLAAGLRTRGIATRSAATPRSSCWRDSACWTASRC